MNKGNNDPKQGARKVTNEDEQEVAVNRSTAQQGGYDEPASQQKPSTTEGSQEGSRTRKEQKSRDESSKR